MSTINFNEVQLPSDWHNVGPIFPRCNLRDGSVDLNGLGKLLYSIRRVCWKRGWAPPVKGSDEKEQEDKEEKKNDNSSDNNNKEQEQTRIFMASNLICLCNVGVYDKTKETDLDISGGGRAAIAHCGSSSYSMYSEAEAVDADDKSGNTKVFVGFQLIALVMIDPKTRRPTKLPEERRLKLLEAVKEGRAPEKITALGVTPLGRLPPHEQIIKSSQKNLTAFQYSIALRAYNDFDFNQHVNQGSYLSWLKDALACMTASEQKIANSNNRTGTSPPYLASTLRVARMDYVEEVITREGQMLVTLFEGEDIDRFAAEAIGSGLLEKLKLVPKTNEKVPKNNLSSGVRVGDMTDLRCGYYTITDETTGRLVNRGFIAFDAIPSSVSDRQKAAVDSKNRLLCTSSSSSSSIKKLLTYSAVGAAGAALGAFLVKQAKL